MKRFDKVVRSGVLQKLVDLMNQEDAPKPRAMSISIERVNPMLASNDSFEDGKKVLEAQKKAKEEAEKKAKEEAEKKAGSRESVEELDDAMFKDLLRKKGKKV